MDHPHVVRLVDVYESSKSLSLVMERLEGGELADRMRSGLRWGKGFAEEAAAQIARQMLLALSYIHGQGIVHRDIKPENFLFSKEGGDSLVLIDFGFSRFFRRGERMLEACGTPGFVAPEVRTGDGYVAGSCDLWSVGVIVSTLLHGCMPFSSSGKPNRMQKLARCWGGLSQHAQDFVQQLLNELPEGRLTAEQALAHPWVRAHACHGLIPHSVVDQHLPEAFAQRRLLEAWMCSDGRNDVLEGLDEDNDAAVEQKFRCFDLHCKSVSSESPAKALDAPSEEPSLRDIDGDACVTKKELTSYVRNSWMSTDSNGSTCCSVGGLSDISATSSTRTTISDCRCSGQASRRPSVSKLSNETKVAQASSWWSPCIAGICGPSASSRARRSSMLGEQR